LNADSTSAAFADYKWPTKEQMLTRLPSWKPVLCRAMHGTENASSKSSGTPVASRKQHSPGSKTAVIVYGKTLADAVF